MPFTHVSFRFSQSLHRDDLISLPSIDVVVNIFFKTFFRSVSASSEVLGFDYRFRFISNTEPYNNVLPVDSPLTLAFKPVFCPPSRGELYIVPHYTPIRQHLF